MSALMPDGDFVFDEVVEFDNNIRFYKTRQVENGKTVYRVIEVEGIGINGNHPFLKELFKQYETSILKDSRDFNDFIEMVTLEGVRATLVPDLKGDKFFDDRWSRVVRFAQKHFNTSLVVSSV